jgi:hypothetical protein
MSRGRPLFPLLLALALFAAGGPARTQTPLPGIEAKSEASREDTLRSPGPEEEEAELLPGAELPVFGANMFTGAFAQQPFTGFNPDYRIQIGDQVRVQLWGAVDFGEALTVDAQGNVFLPKIGPVHVAGVRNDALTGLVRGQGAAGQCSRLGLRAPAGHVPWPVVGFGSVFPRSCRRHRYATRQLHRYSDIAGRQGSADGEPLRFPAEGQPADDPVRRR